MSKPLIAAQCLALVEAANGRLIRRPDGLDAWDCVTTTGSSTFRGDDMRALLREGLIRIEARDGQDFVAMTEAGRAALPVEWRRKIQ